MTRMSFKEYLAMAGQMLIMLLGAAALLAEWALIGLFVYCWYF